MKTFLAIPILFGLIMFGPGCEGGSGTSNPDTTEDTTVDAGPSRSECKAQIKEYDDLVAKAKTTLGEFSARLPDGGYISPSNRAALRLIVEMGHAEVGAGRTLIGRCGHWDPIWGEQAGKLVDRRESQYKQLDTML